MISARNYRTRVDATGTSTNSASTNSPSTNSIGPKQTGAAGFDVALDERVDRAEGVRDRERQVPIELLDRLLVDARIACRRDGVAATRREVLARVAERIGVSRPEIARRLREHADRGGVAAVPGATRARRPQDATLLLATRILGARELAVFRARRRARSDDIAALHRLASRLGIAVERVYELEASARRKMARALA